MDTALSLTPGLLSAMRELLSSSCPCQVVRFAKVRQVHSSATFPYVREIWKNYI